MPPNMGRHRLDLNSYLRDVLFGYYKNEITYKIEEYIDVTEFFERHSTRDDFNENPDIFTSVHKPFDYVGNSDPWHRKFITYKNWYRDITSNKYECRAILDEIGNPMVYVLSTSVEGYTIYCVDRINV